jgi:hypothetical protein
MKIATIVMSAALALLATSAIAEEVRTADSGNTQTYAAPETESAPDNGAAQAGSSASIEIISVDHEILSPRDSR